MLARSRGVRFYYLKYEGFGPHDQFNEAQAALLDVAAAIGVSDDDYLRILEAEGIDILERLRGSDER